MPHRPGKTSPRLFRDLYDYDPKTETFLKRNTLTSGPSFTDFNNNAVTILPEEGCLHNFVERLEPKDVLPPQDSRPGPGTVYELHATCRKCLIHLSLKIEHTDHLKDTGIEFISCPNREYPLHHFQCIAESRTPPRFFAGTGEERKDVLPDGTFVFRCSAAQCLARLTLQFRMPRLGREFIHLMTDQDLLRKRLDTAIELDPGRGEREISTPVSNYELLCVFLTHALDTSRERKTIKCANRRFVKSFGGDCDEMLRELGFTREDDEDGPAWALPEPGIYGNVDAFEGFIVDVRNELALLHFQRPDQEQRSFVRIKNSPIPQVLPRSLSLDISRCLGFATYERTLLARRSMDSAEELQASYAGIGAVHDFADSLVAFAFDRQRECDPEHTSYYFDCLSEITTVQRKNSDILGFRLALLKSEGFCSKRDISDAFKYFGFDASAAKFLDETHVRGVYQNYIDATATATHAETREKLRIVAREMNSRMLEETAANEIETYEQALQYLDGDMKTEDDVFVNALYPIKVQDNANNTELARKAMQIIAEKRNSTYLREWLMTGAATQPAMDFTEACRTLQIEDRTSIDIDNLDLMVMTYCSDAPDREAEFRRAADTIKATLSSQGQAQPQAPSRRPEDWPVGIRNLGNTCYLNSLLQFYFTVRPFREMLLRFDDGFRMANTPENIKSKKVGGRRVTAKEVDRANDFVQQLSQLFAEMITSKENSVQPTLKLASSTLIRPEAKEALRRRSTVGGIRPAGLGEIDGDVVQGPGLPPASELPDATESASRELKIEDSASDTTLLGDVHTPDSDEDMEIVETDEESTKQGGNAHVETPATEKINTRKDSFAIDSKTSTNMQASDDSVPTVPNETPPVRPPPVPPRPKLESNKSELLREVEYAAKQQDVTEVIDNVLFQIECAMRSTGEAEDGEQEDLIKDLFYGKLKWTYPESAKQKVDDKVEIFNAIIVDVASGPRDIYAALDAQFDMHKVNLNKAKVSRFGTIEKLPPFLQVNVQRVGFDREKNVPFKVENHLALPETLFMDRYLAGNEKILKRRERAWKWKEELQKLEWRRDQLALTPIKDVKVPEVLDATWEFVSKLQSELGNGDDDLMDVDPLTISDTLGEELQIRSKELATVLRNLETHISGLKTSIADQFEGLEEHGYRLHALFIHRGSAGAGHYWIYIRDFQRNTWIKYNDDHVDVEADLDTIYKEDPRSPSATPYFLVYVKHGLEDALVDSLCRHPQAATQDTSMTNTAGRIAGGDNADVMMS